MRRGGTIFKLQRHLRTFASFISLAILRVSTLMPFFCTMGAMEAAAISEPFV
jgi:hypothetical protein